MDIHYTNRQIYGETDRQINRQIKGQTDRQIKGQMDRQIDIRLIDTQMNIQTDIQKYR